MKNPIIESSRSRFARTLAIATLSLACFPLVLWGETPLPAAQVEAHPGTPAQQEYLSASLERRQALAEQIGTRGAAQYAANEGYHEILAPKDKHLRHGPDGVYRAPDGKLVVIEAKGGSSALGTSFGFQQGTCENVVLSAKNALSRPNITAQERAAFQAVISEAASGNLRVEVVKTPHVLGEPGKPVLLGTSACSPHAAKLAQSAAKDLAIGDNALHRALSSGGKVIVKLTGGAAVAGGVLETVEGVREIMDGKVLVGTLDSAKGIGDTATGVMLVIARAPYAGPIIAGTAVVDGGKDLIVGISDGNSEQTVIGSIKVAAGTAMAAGLYGGQPVVVIIGGVAYAGVLVYEQKDAIAQGARVTAEYAKRAWDASWNAGAYAVDKTGAALTVAKDATWNAGVYAVEKTAAGFNTAKDATWNAGVVVVEKTDAAFTFAKDATWNAGVYAADQTGAALTTAKDATWNAGVFAVEKTGAALSQARDRVWNWF